MRELENLTRRLAALYPQEVIGEGMIETELSAGSAPPSAALQPPRDDGGKRSRRRPVQTPETDFDAAMERAVAELFKFVRRRQSAGRPLSPRACTISRRR